MKKNRVRRIAAGLLVGASLMGLNPTPAQAKEMDQHCLIFVRNEHGAQKVQVGFLGDSFAPLPDALVDRSFWNVQVNGTRTGLKEVRNASHFWVSAGERIQEAWVAVQLKSGRFWNCHRAF